MSFTKGPLYARPGITEGSFQVYRVNKLGEEVLVATFHHTDAREANYNALLFANAGGLLDAAEVAEKEIRRADFPVNQHPSLAFAHQILLREIKLSQDIL